MFKQSTCLQKKTENGAQGGFVYFTWPIVISSEESAQHARRSIFVCSSGVHFSNVGVNAMFCLLSEIRWRFFLGSSLSAASKEHKGYNEHLYKIDSCCLAIQVR